MESISNSDNKTLYQSRVENRSYPRYLKGLAIRWANNLKFQYARYVARKNGAVVGDTAVFPISLAKKLNSNCHIGDHVSIQTDNIDIRSRLWIGDHVIIGQDVRILTASHDINSPEWNFKTYGLEIEDYVWIATGATILPSCRKLSYGTVVGGGLFVPQEYGTYGCSQWQSCYFSEEKRNCSQQSCSRIFIRWRL